MAQWNMTKQQKGPYKGRCNILQATAASALDHESSQTVPH